MKMMKKTLPRDTAASLLQRRNTSGRRAHPKSSFTRNILEIGHGGEPLGGEGDEGILDRLPNDTCYHGIDMSVFSVLNRERLYRENSPCPEYYTEPLESTSSYKYAENSARFARLCVAKRNARFYEMDGAKLAFSGNVFDEVYMFYVFGFASINDGQEYANAMLAESFRVLRSGGMAIFIDNYGEETPSRRIVQAGFIRAVLGKDALEIIKTRSSISVLFWDGGIRPFIHQPEKDYIVVAFK
jgi:SAM-dependent methyltransferase